MDKNEAILFWAKRLTFFSKSHTDDEWEAFYDDMLQKLKEHPYAFGNFAILLCYQWIFTRCIIEDDNFDEALAMPKVTLLAKTIFALGDSTPLMTAYFFCTFFKLRKADYFIDWWQKAYQDKTPGFTHETYLIGVIEQKSFDHTTWKSTSEFLVPYLDHKSDFVRASAAAALGELFMENAKNAPQILELIDEIKAKEILRPGVAGPFWGKLNDWFETDYKLKNRIEFDQLEWLLEILEQRDGDELDHPGYKGVEVLAYSLADNNVDAIRRLFKLGAYNRVYDLAFEFSQFSDEFKDLLIEMGNSDDYHMQTTATCLLAYEYKYVHPNCERLGRIKEFDLEDATIIMIYGKEVPLLAAAIHPKQGKLTDSLAWKWINNLLPPDDRQGDWEPEIEDDTITYGGEDRTVVLYGNVHDKLWDKVVIKTPTREVVID